MRQKLSEKLFKLLEKGLPIDTSTDFGQMTLWLGGLDYEVKPQGEEGGEP